MLAHGATVSKAQAVRQVPPAGMHDPGDIADIVKSGQGLDIPKARESAYQ